MPRTTLETRRILELRRTYSVSQIQERLKEKIFISKVTIYAIIKKYRVHHTCADLPKPQCKTILNKDQVRFIDKAMENNDKLTGRQLHELLLEIWPDLQISISTIKRVKRMLGWVCSRPKYCQLVRELNKLRRVEWCTEQIAAQEDFGNVIFTDECSIQLDNHGRLCFRKRGSVRKIKPKPKHPVKVHVWAGISKHGATSIVIFTGIMNADKYCVILDTALKPFLANVFPRNDYRFQQDNDPKHISRTAKQYFEQNNINWWKTPAESPDLNPIENVWASLKYYLRHQHKPTNLETLKEGILNFWKSMTPTVCSTYIQHLHKVMPRVIEVNGNASGF